MFGFIIKKNFCDGWDNLFSVFIYNIVFLFSVMGLVLLNSLFLNNMWLSLAGMLFSFVVVSILVFAYSDIAAHIANFEGFSFWDYFKAIPGVLKDATLFGLMNAAVILISCYSIRYYFTEANSLVGIAIGCIIVWILLFYLLGIQWFIPIRGLMHNNFKKCLKKSFLILFDNTGFTIAYTFYNLILAAISVVLIGFFPSMTGILLGNTNALRILLYKYDYLEEHPELKTKKERGKIPWNLLIAEDREILGPRTLRSFLFPWKDSNQQDL